MLRDVDGRRRCDRGLGGDRRRRSTRFVAKGTLTAGGRRRGAGPDHHDHRPGRGRRRRHRRRGGRSSSSRSSTRSSASSTGSAGTAPCWPPTPRAIPITQIAAVTERPGGGRRHPLLLAGADDGARASWSAATRPATRRWPTARAFAEAVGKTCIVVNRDVAGFVTTRLICALAMEAIRLVETGVASRRGHRHRLPARLRPRDGPARHHRPDRRRHPAATPRMNIYDRDRRREVLPAGDADPDGDRRRPRPQDRPGLLLLRHLSRAAAPVHALGARPPSSHHRCAQPPLRRRAGRPASHAGLVSHRSHRRNSVAPSLPRVGRLRFSSCPWPGNLDGLLRVL